MHFTNLWEQVTFCCTRINSNLVNVPAQWSGTSLNPKTHSHFHMGWNFLAGFLPWLAVSSRPSEANWQQKVFVRTLSTRIFLFGMNLETTINKTQLHSMLSLFIHALMVCRHLWLISNAKISIYCKSRRAGRVFHTYCVTYPLKKNEASTFPFTI